MSAKVPNPIDVQVGARLRLRRMLMNMSQEKLGERIGLTFQQIQKYEKGTNRMGASRLHQIGQVLGVSVSYFYEGIDESENALGFAETPKAFVDDATPTPESLQLTKSFMRVKNQKTRRKIIELVRTLADEDENS